jgi:hypothetical protein
MNIAVRDSQSPCSWIPAFAGMTYRVSITGETDMAKGQKKSNKEARKPKKEVKKTIAAAPSSKGVVKD